MNSIDNNQPNTNVNPAQVQNYITWINSHLKKRPGVKLVENLHVDITNGVPLIHLIEVISGDVLADVNLNPKNANEFKENIDKVLKFMQLNNVKIARTTSKEILDGNIKSIMRVILALAAHFKPSNLQKEPSGNQSNRQPSVTSSNSTTNINKVVNSMSNVLNNQANSKNNNMNSTRTISNIDSMTHLVQAACVSFADVRRYKNENFNVKYVRRNNLLLNGQPSPINGTSNRNKFNLTTAISNSYTNVADAVDSAKPEITTLNNKTYITNNNNPSNNKSPIRRYRPKFETAPDDFSFSNSVLVSPSHHNPIASSTILSQTLLQSKNPDEKLVTNQTYSKNITHIIIDNNQIETNTNISNNNNEIESKTDLNQSNSSSKQNSVNNNTIIITKEKSHQNESQLEQNEQLIEVPELLDECKSLKNILLSLQKMLMTGDLNDLTELANLNLENENDSSTSADTSENQSDDNNKSIVSNDSNENDFALSNLTKDEQIAILRSKIQQLEILNNDLKTELNQTKSESMNNYGMQSGLKSRLTELDNNILEIKSEQINLQLTNQQLVNEKEKLIHLLEQQANDINKLKNELTSRDEMIDKLKIEMNSLVKTNLLKKQIKNIADIEEIQEKESVISGLIANRKLCIIDSKLSNGGKKGDSTFIVNKFKRSNSKQIITDEETSIIRDTLNQLRHNFKPSHPSLFLIDTLEQSILSISERSNYSDSEIEIMNYTKSKTKQQQTPNSIGLITSSTSSINSSSSSSSNSSSVVSSSANSPVLSTINQYQNNQLIYSTAPAPPSFQRYISQSANNGIKRIDFKNKEIELPIVNNSEQTNVKKIISRLLSQSNNNNCLTPSPVVSTSSTVSHSNQQFKKKLETEFISPSSIQPLSKSQMNSCSSSMLLTISSSGSTITSSNSSSSAHSPTSSSSSTSSICNLNSSTKCIYFKNKETTPYITTVFKSINNVCLKDFRERIAKQLDHKNKYKFYFKSHEPEFGYLREEITNENTILPVFENQIVAWVVEVE